MKEKEKLKEIIKEEKTRKVFEKVFDYPTLMAVYKIAKKGYFNKLEFIISTGKEAHVFFATDKSNNPRAVKIYKTTTSDFKNMEKYIKGDHRFAAHKKTKKDVVFTWAKKEFKNLSTATEAGASVPKPLFVLENILVMEFIGGDSPAKTLKETRPDKSELENYFEQTIDFIAKIFFTKELIHADLSEYNILVHKKKLFVIDMGQSVISTHPKAKEFFERDIKNIAIYFSKNGVETGFEELMQKVREKKKKYKKQ